MQMPKPTKFHKKLAALVGDWTGDETMHPVPWDPTGGPAKGRYRVRAALDGFGVVQEYEQKRGGKVSYVGHGVLGYDTKENCYLWHWSDSMGGVPNQVTRGQWDGKTLVFTASCEQGHSRYTYVFKKPDVLDFAIEMSMDGQQWMPFMNGRYTRKAAKA
jgi:hypothetical protein